MKKTLEQGAIEKAVMSQVIRQASWLTVGVIGVVAGTVGPLVLMIVKNR